MFATPFTGASAGNSSSASGAPLLGFGDIVKKPSGSWECDVCLVQNKAADAACVACQTAKPGAKVEVKGKETSRLKGSFVWLSYCGSGSSNMALMGHVSH